MMTFWGLAAVVVSCLVTSDSAQTCWQQSWQLNNTAAPLVAGVAASTIVPSIEPVFTGQSLDVELTAQAALAWDEQTDTVLYLRAGDDRRPVASLSKLLSALTVREAIDLSTVIEIPASVRQTQRRGAHVSLPPGEHVSVYDLLSAGMIASANDALTAMAYGVAKDEEEFAQKANDFARRHGFYNTKISNATGLDGGEQYSTAQDIKGLFQLAYRDATLRNMLSGEDGVLITEEGSRRRYTSTNKLLGTYFPVLAAKTGYTPAAGENLVVMTYGDQGQRIGAVVLGSSARFQDVKTLVEWVKRNYTWP